MGTITLVVNYILNVNSALYCRNKEVGYVINIMMIPKLRLEKRITL